MALIDYEAVVLDLEEHVRSKNSHGQRELTDLLADLRVQHRITEGLPEKVGRVYLPALVTEIASSMPADQVDLDTREMAGSSPHRGSRNGSEGDSSNGHPHHHHTAD